MYVHVVSFPIAMKEFGLVTPDEEGFYLVSCSPDHAFHSFFTWLHHFCHGKRLHFIWGLVSMSRENVFFFCEITTLSIYCIVIY